MTQAELLSSAPLRLNATIRKSGAQPNRVLLRTAGGTQRLALTQKQAAILFGQFARPSTVPETLVHLLGKNDCPPMGEYYELVLQAQAAGVLVTGSEPTEHTLAQRWPGRIPPRVASWLGTVAILAGAGALLLKSWIAPVNWFDWLAGWLAVCALLTLGEMLAACVLASAECEVRARHFHWTTLLPHLRFDAGEAVMGGRACELAVALFRAAPVTVGAGIIAWQQPGWLAPVLIGLLYVLAPWGGSPASQWVRARYGSLPLSVSAGYLFEPRRKDTWTRLRAWWTRLGPVSILLWLVWILALATVFARSLPDPAARLLAGFGPTGRLHPLINVGIYSLATALVVAIGALMKSAFIHWRFERTLKRPLRDEAAAGSTPPALPDNTPGVLRQLALFQTLAEDDRTTLAAAMQPVEIEKRREVFHEDDPGDAFYIVQEGRLEILKQQPKPSKRTDLIGWLEPGSGFGEIALLEGTVRSATVRATRRSRLLRLAKEDFDRLVVARVGAARVRELLQYATFLGRLVFLAGWPFNDLVRYAQACNSVCVPAGGVVLQRGAPNLWFYLIYDGAFEARDGGRVLRRMQPGDYFGEISLLGNVEATATVVATEESRCLTMSREDFLGFFAKDFRIGLRIEALATERLGSRLFASR